MPASLAAEGRTESYSLNAFSRREVQQPARWPSSPPCSLVLYCGTGIGVAVLRRALRANFTQGITAEAALTRVDMPWLAGAIVAGGIFGPILLMVGLARTDAAAAPLLLTWEGVATALPAWFVFHENFDRRIAVGMAACRRRYRAVLVGYAKSCRPHRATGHPRGVHRLGFRQ